MSVDHSIFNNLRQKLDVLGYTQMLNLGAIPLVGALFEDLVKMTESLHEAKEKIINLLEEKSCWELGVEPYKCDNGRLLAENNELHMELMKQREEVDTVSCELNQRIRKLKADKLHLKRECDQLRLHLKTLSVKQMTQQKVNASHKLETNMKRRPFVSTVRSTENFSNNLNGNVNLRCSRCLSSTRLRASSVNDLRDTKSSGRTRQMSLDKLEDSINDLKEEVAAGHQKIEMRDREIQRLSKLLSAGRPTPVLARECCYKDVRKLSEDVEVLQQEKTEIYCKSQMYEDQMHEAMNRVMDLEVQSEQLTNDYDKLKEVALTLERQANKEIEERDIEISRLRGIIERLRGKPVIVAGSKRQNEDDDCGDGVNHVTDATPSSTALPSAVAKQQKVAVLEIVNSTQERKIMDLQHQINELKKELRNHELKQHFDNDEERIRIKCERDFFQAEYLRLCEKAANGDAGSTIYAKGDKDSAAEAALHCDNTVSTTMAEAKFNKCRAVPASGHYSVHSSGVCDSVQAVILRAKRDRGCALHELERMRCDRDILREKLVNATRMHAAETKELREQLHADRERLRQLESEAHALYSARRPSEAQISLLREEIESLRKQLSTMQDENTKLRTSHSQLKILHGQTERSMYEYQSKLLVANAKLENAETQKKTLDTYRECASNDVAQLHNEVATLKKTALKLETEKDTMLVQLQTKSENVITLEHELTTCKTTCNTLEKQVTRLEDELGKIKAKTRSCHLALNEVTTEGASLRDQLTAMKVSRDEALKENGHLTNDLADSQAQILTLKKQVRGSMTEIERLQDQMRKYVQKVNKAEDLLLYKEKEREEMLDNYRNLSESTVLLEDSNQSLEMEALEYKRQANELEATVTSLKWELNCRNDVITRLEERISTMMGEMRNVERKLVDAVEAQRLLKTDLMTRNELCEKVDVENAKLKIEFNEFKGVRKRLEIDNERLRDELDKAMAGTKVLSSTSTELLRNTRQDLDEQIKVNTKLSQEVLRLQQRNAQLLTDYENERERREQNETLAHEYQVQNQELRHNITDDRFRMARSREQSPHILSSDALQPSTTL